MVRNLSRVATAGDTVIPPASMLDSPGLFDHSGCLISTNIQRDKRSFSIWRVLRERRSGLWICLLLCLAAPVRSADLPLYVHYLPFNPPNLFLRTTRVTQAFFNPAQTSGNTVNYNFSLTATTTLAPGPIPVTLAAFGGSPACPGTRTVLVSLDFIIGGVTTNIGSVTQTVTVGTVPFVPVFDFNGISLADTAILNAGDSVRLQVTNTTSTTSTFCIVNEFPLGGVDTDASRVVLQTGPLINLDRSVNVINDPVSGVNNPKAIPGAQVRYTLVITNDPIASEVASNAVISDEIPANTTYTFGDNLITLDGVPQTDANDAPVDNTDFDSTAPNSITTDLGIIGIGESHTLTYDVTID